MYNRALRIIREFHRMTQTDAASLLGISNSYLSEIEGGQKQPSLNLLERYALIYKIPLSSILLFAESSEDSSAAAKLRTFSADKILKVLEWLEGASDVEGGREGNKKASADRLPPLRNRVPGGSRSQTRDERRRAGAPR